MILRNRIKVKYSSTRGVNILSTDSIYKYFTGVTQFTSELKIRIIFSPESSDLLGVRGRGVLILKDKGLKFKCWFKLLVKIKENLPWREWVDVHFLDITSVDCTLRSLRKKSRHLLIKGMSNIWILILAVVKGKSKYYLLHNTFLI